MGGTIRAAFLSAFNLPKEVYLANSALMLLFIDTSRLLTYFSEGASLDKFDILKVFASNPISGLAICVATSYLGAKVGEAIVNKVPQKIFRIIIAGFLIVIGVKLALAL